MASYHQQNNNHRQSIRQSPKNHCKALPSWKDALKEKCLERAREKRKDTLRKRRSPSSMENDSSNSFPYNSGNFGSIRSIRTPNSLDTARQVVQEQLFENGVQVYSSAAPKSNLMYTTPIKDDILPNALFHFSPLPMTSPSFVKNKTTPSSGDSSMVNQVPPFSCTTLQTTKNRAATMRKNGSMIHGVNLFVDENSNRSGENEKNFISEEELYELMQEVEEELCREQEARIQHEINTVEAEEERKMGFVEEQIDAFQSEADVMMDFENVVVPCPLCQAGSLIQDTNNGNIYCQHYCQDASMSSINTTRKCKLLLNGVTSLEYLRGKLFQAYEEHSLSCSGVLQFDLCRKSFNVNDSNLVAYCNNCKAEATIV